ncbi:hypothetical protein [Pseudomonas aeruginosa]|uniref:hypothetical protein n=1 Tax=Pseudomonas aeruginosa TaxID=287 RepID=UPI0022381439|nr:hypothetical protein [Pseudomonas aeruginosa]
MAGIRRKEHERSQAGGGCTSRYDIDALGDEDGTEFPGAAELWRRLQENGGEMAEGSADRLRKTPRDC